MPQLNWTPQALSDLQRLYRFLALKDINVARNAIREIRRSVKILTDQPASGRPVVELSPLYREWPINFGNSGYVALYRFDKDDVTLLTIRHQKEAGWS